VRGLKESKGLLKVGIVARRLGISVPSVYRLAANGEIPCIRIGPKSVRFDIVEIERYVQRRKAG
jgi:excisionase family DNA binding protein